jgi:hypothetical protein
MKLYYNGKGYPCKWKTQMKDNNMWYSMEPVKLTVTIPRSLYDVILLDIKLDKGNNTLNDIFRFNLLIQKGEMSRDRDKLVADQNELWSMETYLNRSTISSKFKNDEVTVLFYLSVFEDVELDKSELRNLLLNELV